MKALALAIAILVLASGECGNPPRNFEILRGSKIMLTRSYV